MECPYAALDKVNQSFIEDLRKVVRNKTGTRPNLSTVINAILVDYRQHLERESELDFLTAYRKVSKRAKHR